MKELILIIFSYSDEFTLIISVRAGNVMQVMITFMQEKYNILYPLVLVPKGKTSIL